MLHVIQAVSEQIGDMSIQAVKDLSPLFTRLYEPHLPQRAHVMRNRRLAQANRFGQRADVLFAFDQHGNDTHATGVAESAEQFGEVRGGMLVKHNRFRSTTSGHSLIIEYLFRYS